MDIVHAMQSDTEPHILEYYLNEMIINEKGYLCHFTEDVKMNYANMDPLVMQIWP